MANTARYKIADVIFEINTFFNYTHNMCKKYLYDGEGKTECVVTVQKADVLFERENDDKASPDYYLESLAVYRKINDYIMNNASGMIFHCSAVAVDGKCYVFTARSGTGKSTHTRLWRELLGDKAVMINDDKPIVREINGEFYIYGTPWNGKHNIDTNVRAKLSAICEIKRAKQNKIQNISAFEMLMVLLNQTVRPEQEEQADIYLKFLDRMLNSVSLYRLECNMNIQAAELSYNTMSKGN